MRTTIHPLGYIENVEDDALGVIDALLVPGVLELVRDDAADGAPTKTAKKATAKKATAKKAGR